MWSDEADFCLEGQVNTPNCRLWAAENPNTFQEKPMHPKIVTGNIYHQRSPTLPDLKESIRRHLLDIPAELLRSTFESIILRLQHIVDHEGDRFKSCQVIYSQFGLAIHQNDHQARRGFIEWAQNEIAVVPDFHKRILFSDEAHFWLNGYVNKQNCRIWREANPQVYVETPLHPEKLTVWCALWAGGILLQKR
ncbi:hypothetical protein TNCV_871791 [Trichonephila clavipes]|nr:hypothetical protein TNCV_871791 [Trichonephila clavipes]